MSFDNLQNKWNKQETELLISIVRGRKITDPNLMEEALEKIPNRNRGGIKRKLERLEQDGKLAIATKVASSTLRLQPEFKRMINILSEEYDVEEIAHAIGLTEQELRSFYGSETTTVEEPVEEKPKDTRPQLADYVRMVREEGMTIKEVAAKYNANLGRLQEALVPHFKNEINNFNYLVTNDLTDTDKESLAADNIAIPEPILDRITDDVYRVGNRIQKHLNNGWSKQPFYMNHHKLVRFYYDGQALD